MSDRIYNKPPSTFEGQVTLLQGRGLIIRNPEKATRILQNISYNRLSNYWEPFLAEPKDVEHFKPGTEFNTIFRLYKFDSDLRTLVFNAIEQIEVALRTQVIYRVSHKEDSGYGYLNQELYQSNAGYYRMMLRISEAVKESKLPFVLKFKRKYSNEQLPAWKSFELISFRSLFALYKNLVKCPEKLAISRHFGLHHMVLESWLDALVYLRNVCAHHARFWNIVMTISPVWPRSPHYAWVDRWENELANVDTRDKRLKTYAGLCMIQYLISRVNPYNNFAGSLFTLLGRYPEANEDWIGMPANWQDQPLWQATHPAPAAPPHPTASATAPPDKQSPPD